MAISRIVRIGAVVAAVVLVSACTGGSGAVSATTTAPATAPATTVTPPSSALDAAGRSTPPTTTPPTTTSTTTTSTTTTSTTTTPMNASSTAGTAAPASSGPAGPAVPSAGSTAASSQTSFGVIYVGVTADWTGDQLFTKPRSDGTPVAPGSFGSGVSAKFHSPSGNISCQIQVDTPNGSSDGAVCQINAHKYATPAPPADVNCSSEYGRAVQLLPVGVRVECPIPDGAPNPGAGGPPLPAGSQLNFGGVTCLSTDYGIRCLDDERQVGFVIGQNILATIEP